MFVVLPSTFISLDQLVINVLKAMAIVDWSCLNISAWSTIQGASAAACVVLTCP
jgi:hypothetical protein